MSLVCADATSKPVQHGLGKLKLALQQKGVVVEEAASLKQATGKHLVVIGLTSGTSEAARLITELQLAPGKEPESLLIRKLQREGKDLLLVAGSDARGLMYALLDVADRAGWAKSAEQPFSEVRDAEEKPLRARAGTVHLHLQPCLVGKPLLRRGLLGTVSRCAGPEPVQFAGRHLRLRKRRLPRALLSLFLRRGGISLTCEWWASRASNSSAISPR